MTQEEILENLMRPRYKVIGLWPYNCPYSLNSIIHESENIEGSKFFKETVHKFPHLFKLLEWWEERTIEEMPKYVKWLEIGYMGLENELSGVIEEVKDVQKYLATFSFKVDSQINSIRAEYFAPSSKEEYLNYIKQKQP